MYNKYKINQILSEEQVMLQKAINSSYFVTLYHTIIKKRAIFRKNNQIIAMHKNVQAS